MNTNLYEDRYYNLFILMQKVNDLISRTRHNELYKYNFTPRQAAILFVYKIVEADEGTVTPGKLSKRMLQEPHAISKILTRMANEGLISKTKRSGKKGEVIIKITEKGEQAYNHSLKRESIWNIMSCLSEEEYHQLFSILEKLQQKAILEFSVRQFENTSFSEQFRQFIKNNS